METFKPKTLNNEENKYWEAYKYWKVKEKLKIGREVSWSTWGLLYCFATLSTDETTTSWTTKTLTLNTFDTNDTWMSVTNWRITITRDWLYSVSWAVTYASNSTWTREVLLRKNGTTNTNMHYQANQSAWDLTSCVFNRYFNFVAWDYIEVRVYQTSWWNLNVTSNTQRTFIQVIKQA